MLAKYLSRLALLAVIGLCGCSSSGSQKHVALTLKYITTDSAPQQNVSRYTESALTEAATSANATLQEISALSISKHRNKPMPALPNADKLHLATRASVNWTGPATTLLRTLAKAGHYKISFVGRKPSIPMLVTLRENDKTLASLIRNVQYQLAKKATIAIYPRRKIIEVRFHNM